MEWNYKDMIVRRVIAYYVDHPPVNEQIVHTQAVASYTRLIAIGEGLDAHQVDLLEMAAWMHDIGCPKAREIYGNSLPPHQEKEGRILVNEWLLDEPELTAEEKVWLADVVGSHHHFAAAQKLHFESLFEADLIVNLWEGYYKLEHANSYYEKMMVTETGRRLFSDFFLRKG